MKIKFDKLETSNESIKVSFNGVEHSDKAGGALTDQVLIELLS